MRVSTSEQGTPVKKSKPCRSRRAASSAPDTTPGSPPRGPPVLLLLEELLLLRLHLLHQLLVRRGRDDLVELGPVVRDEADALDDDVIDEPLVAPGVHPIVDGNLGPLLRHEPRTDDRAIEVGGLAHDTDFLAPVELDLRDVGTLEKVREEQDELVAFGLCPRRPVPRERALGRLREIEDVVGDLANGGPSLPLLTGLFELRVLQDLDRPVDLRTALVGRRTRPDPVRAGEDERQHRGKRECAGETGHRRPPTPYTLPKMYLDSNSSKSTGASTSRILPFGGMIFSDPPGLMRMYFSPISPFVLIDAIASSCSLIPVCTRSVTRAW